MKIGVFKRGEKSVKKKEEQIMIGKRERGAMEYPLYLAPCKSILRSGVGYSIVWILTGSGACRIPGELKRKSLRT